MLLEIFIFIYGLIIGSFLNVLIYRLPLDNISFFSPKRSMCPSCNYQIKWYENIPLFSYIWLKAKCANCSTRISINYFLVELITAILTLAIYKKIGFSSDFFIVLILFYLLIVLSFIDLKYKAVPDYLLLFVLIVMLFTEDFTMLYSLVFAGTFVLLNFVITFYIQNIKAKITKNKDLETQVALGEGDIPIIAMIGGVLGFQLGLAAVFLAAIFAFFPSVYAMLFKKDIETPFIPYLVLGFVCCFFFESNILQIMGTYGL